MPPPPRLFFVLAWLNLLAGFALLFPLGFATWALVRGAGPTAFDLRIWLIGLCLVLAVLAVGMGQAARDYLRRPNRADARSLASNTAVLAGLATVALNLAFFGPSVHATVALLLAIAVGVLLHRAWLLPILTRAVLPPE